MPDFQNFSITRLANQNVNIPRWSISLQVVDSQTGALIRDFTGANAITFPQVLGQLTNAQQDEMVELIVSWLIRKRAGLD
jgi:hypothetical protein